MINLEKALAARKTVSGQSQSKLQVQERSYSSENSNFTPSKEHHHEAEGLALAAQSLAAQYNNDPTDPDFLDHIDALNGHDSGEDSGRSFSDGSHSGMELVPSKRNPAVRRWVRIMALGHIGRKVNNAAVVGGAAVSAGHYGAGFTKHLVGSKHPLAATAGAAASIAALALGAKASRYIDHGKGLEAHENSLNPAHYLKNHADSVNRIAQKTGNHPKTIAHALAFQATIEHRRMGAVSNLDRKNNKGYHAHVGKSAVKAFEQNVAKVK